MLHLEETLIDQRFALPSVDVLADEHISEELEQLLDRDRYVIPALLLDHLGQWMVIDVVPHHATWTKLELLPVVGSTGIALPRVGALCTASA